MKTSTSLTLVSLALSTFAVPVAAQTKAAAPPKAESAPQAAAIVQNLTGQLRNLVSAEEAYYADKSTYSNSLKALGYVAREGAYITVFRADNRGWVARAVHPDWPGKSCVILVGPSGEAAPAKTDATQISGKEGVPVCDPT